MAGIVTGLSSDTKPTNIPDNALFVETDTQKLYVKVAGSYSRVKL